MVLGSFIFICVDFNDKISPSEESANAKVSASYLRSSFKYFPAPTIICSLSAVTGPFSAINKCPLGPKISEMVTMDPQAECRMLTNKMDGLSGSLFGMDANRF